MGSPWWAYVDSMGRSALNRSNTGIDVHRLHPALAREQNESLWHEEAPTPQGFGRLKDVNADWIAKHPRRPNGSSLAELAAVAHRPARVPPVQPFTFAERYRKATIIACTAKRYS